MLRRLDASPLVLVLLPGLLLLTATSLAPYAPGASVDLSTASSSTALDVTLAHLLIAVSLNLWLLLLAPRFGLVAGATAALGLLSWPVSQVFTTSQHELWLVWGAVVTGFWISWRFLRSNIVTVRQHGYGNSTEQGDEHAHV